MSMKYLVPALAVAGRAAAQSSCSAATTTVQNAGDASAVAMCQTFTGDIAIATGTTDNLDFSGQLREIRGSLIAEEATSLVSMSSSSLQTITDTFMLNGLTLLSTLNFPALTSVENINWEALPALQGLSFTETVQQASSVQIQNTEMNSLDGLNLQVVDTLLLVNNPYLNKVDMQLGNISTALTIGSNGRDLTLNFPNLIWANNMTISNASEVMIPSLASVNGSFGLYNCDFESLYGPNLTRIGSALALNTNANLVNLTMPQLTNVGGALNVANNTALNNISFPALQQIGGALDFYGNFTDVSLPNIDLIKGAFNMQSSSDINETCAHFSDLKGSNNVIRGRYNCRGSVARPSSNLNGGGSGSGTNSGTDTSGGFATSLMIPTAGTFVGVVAAIFGIF